MIPYLAIAFLAIGAVTAGVFGGLAMRNFRRLVDYQFENHHDEWVKSGRPLGSERTRREASFWGSDFAGILAIFMWPAERPDWLPEGSAADLIRLEARGYLLLAFGAGGPIFCVGVFLLSRSLS